MFATAAWSNHVLADARLANLDSRFDQFSMDARRAPQGILAADFANEIAKFLRNHRTARLAAPCFPRPEQPESLTVPCDHGFRPKDQQRGLPSAPELGEPSPEQPVDCCGFGALHRTIQDSELMTKGYVFQFQGSV